MDGSQEPKWKPSIINQSIVPIQEQWRDEKQSHSFSVNPLLKDGNMQLPWALKIGGNFFAEVLDLENLKGTWQTFLNF